MLPFLSVFLVSRELEDGPVHGIVIHPEECFFNANSEITKRLNVRKTRSQLPAQRIFHIKSRTACNDDV